jgi:RND family efflux transporter MFP subunit
MTARRRNRLLIAIVLVVLAAGAAAWFLFGRAPVVQVARPTRGPAIEAVYATGAVEPVYWAKVSSTVVGRITEIRHKEGDHVKLGDVLFRLDDREARARLAEAEARRKFLAQEQERYAKLAVNNIASRRQYQEIVSKHAEAIAAVAAARQKLLDYTIRAPLSGEILRLDGNVGEVIRAGDALAWVGVREPMRIEAEVDEEDIPQVKKGQTVLVRADAFPGKAFEAKVTSITAKGDPVSKIYRVRITLPKGTPLHIGMTTEVNIVVRKHDNALLLPFTAVSGGKVWVVRDGRAYRRAVETGIVGARRIEIRKGVAADDRVIVNPPAGLEDGDRVAARRAKPPANGG